jgi:hypothetical protein
MARKTGNYDEYHREWLKDPQNAAAFINAVIEDSDREAFLLALKDVAQAQYTPDYALNLTLFLRNCFDTALHRVYFSTTRKSKFLFLGDDIMRTFTVALISLVVMMSCTLAFAAVDNARQRAFVTGTVLLPNGAPVVGVTVRAYDKATGSEVVLGETLSDSRGGYSISYSAERALYIFVRVLINNQVMAESNTFSHVGTPGSTIMLNVTIPPQTSKPQQSFTPTQITPQSVQQYASVAQMAPLATGPQGPPGPQGPKGPPGPQGPKGDSGGQSSSLPYFAYGVVTANGTLNSYWSKNISSINRINIGEYLIKLSGTFKYPVCTVNPGNIASPPSTCIVVGNSEGAHVYCYTYTLREGGKNVITYSGAYNPVDTDLVVQCMAQ